MKEMNLKIKSVVDLEAILTTPENQTDKVFLIVSGSGKGDLDGNYKSLKLNLYKYLSDYLVEEGFATLRYNKRGVGNSEGNFNTTGLHDLLEDMDKVITYLKERYKKVYVLGHSEGAILATIYNDQHHIDGMVLLSGAGTDLKSAINYQQQNVLDEIKTLKGFKGSLLRLLVKEKKLWDKQNKFYERIEKSTKDTIRIQLIPIQSKWMREHFAYSKESILNMLEKVTVPTLVITGTKDVQSNVKDLEDIEQLKNKHIDTLPIEDMTHMLRVLDGEKTMLNLKKQYKGDIKKPITETLYNGTSLWLKKLEHKA